MAQTPPWAKRLEIKIEEVKKQMLKFEVKCIEPETRSNLLVSPKLWKEINQM